MAGAYPVASQSGLERAWSGESGAGSGARIILEPSSTVPNRPQRACPTGGYCCFPSSERFAGYPGGEVPLPLVKGSRILAVPDPWGSSVQLEALLLGRWYRGDRESRSNQPIGVAGRAAACSAR